MSWLNRSFAVNSRALLILIIMDISAKGTNNGKIKFDNKVIKGFFCNSNQSGSPADMGKYDSLKINWNKQKSSISIQFKYHSIIEGGLHEFFSTNQLKDNINGFLWFPEGFYIKLEVGSIPKEFRAREVSYDLLKIGVDRKKQTISWTIYTKSPFTPYINNDIRIYSTTVFQSDVLKGLYYSLTVLNHHPNKMNKKTNSSLSMEQMKARDFRFADQFRYSVSPNTDSSRSNSEYLAGTASNIGHYK